MTKTIRVFAPSNIALIKYWGKSDEEKQWPFNDSLSMTLKNCCTKTEVKIIDKNEDEIYFFGRRTKDPKIKKHLDFLRSHLNVPYRLNIQTENTFPDQAGIASSASGLAALTIATLCAFTKTDSFEQLKEKGFTLEDLAHLSRLGSGSAGRSLFPGFVHWQRGQTHDTQKITPVPHAKHLKLADLIILVDTGKKKLSSSMGHKRASSSPHFKKRLEEVPLRLEKMKKNLKEGLFSHIGPLIEEESQSMHHVMQTTSPPFSYYGDKTKEVLRFIEQLRVANGLEIYATLDAGPNVHTLMEKKNIKPFMETYSKNFDYQIIHDEMGPGPKIEVSCE